MSEAAASATDEDTKEEPNLQTKGARSLRVQNEDPMEEEVKPLEERTLSPSLPPSKRT